VSLLIKAFAADGHKVAVIAIDPSSPYSGGAILGDRVRMNDAAGYSPVINETVGVGQDEVEIVTAAHTVVVLSAPGLGDDIQAIKAGILEIADVHAVTKSDRPEAAATLAALQAMMALEPARSDPSWMPPMLSVSSLSGDRIGDLKQAIMDHWAHLRASGEFAKRQRNICRTRIVGIARDLFQRQFDDRSGALDGQLQLVVDRQIDPYTVARLLLGSRSHGQEQ
jgi:LAO/AO transport system kinase